MLVLIACIAVQLGVDARLVQELAIHENSRLDPNKVGLTGDLGLFQINPEYLDYFIEQYWSGDKQEVIRVLGKYEKFNWRDPRHNTYMGVRILRSLMEDPRLNTWQALIAYNCGKARVLSGLIPQTSLDSANKIFTKWQLADGVVLR